MNYILECNNLSKVYSGFLALDRLNLKIPSGRIIGLLDRTAHRVNRARMLSLK